MRFAIIGTRGYPYVYSGYETFVAELAPRLIAKGHSVVVYCHKQLFSDRPPKVNGIDLVYLPAIEQKTLSQFTHTFLSTLHAVLQRYDAILYVNSANGPFGLLTKLARKNTAINVDGLEWLRPKWKGLGAKYFRVASYLATKLFDVVITDSVEMARVYQQEFNAHSETIAYGANIGESRNAELVCDLGLRPGDYYLIVGRLIPDNNADLIVRAFEKCSATRKLVILGDVPYRDHYATAIRRTNDKRIIFPGYIRDSNVLRELYSNAYAYIHGHEFGGTNPALLKALAYGCCVYALDTPFSREVLCNERHAMYFQKNVESVIAGLDFLEGNQIFVEEKRSVARSRILANYTWEKITQQYEDLLIQVSSRH